MTEQEAQNQLMDYLYNEMDDEQKVAFEKYLESNPKLQKELKEMQNTHNLLDSVPTDTPAYKFIGVPQQPKNKRVYTFMKPALAVAASLLIGVMIFAFANMEMGQTENGFYLTFGSPPVEESVSEEAVVDLMNQIRNENQVLMAAMFEQNREQQNEQLELVLTELTQYYETRRDQDLLLVAEGFAQLEEETTDRFVRTNETIEDIFLALYNQ
ncbi:MAG: hypothetical protein WEA58_11600 [Balneolaceae bacterium]